MKRMIGMVAAMALATSTAAYAQNTLPEIHSFFSPATAGHLVGGIPAISAANLTSNPNITANPGDHVVLAVWIRALQGNAAAQAAITSYNYDIAASGNLTHFAAGARRQRAAGASYADTPGTPIPGDGITQYNDGSPNSFATQLFGTSGATSGAGSSAEVNSGAAGDALGSFMVQVVEVVVSPLAVAGDQICLYLSTPKTGGATYATSAGAAGSLLTTAYGATAAGTLDQKRISNPTADIVGSLNDRLSTTCDAVIRVPEPGTLGLLALGLLGLRRRRS